MMGEYILYHYDRVIGGIYDDRFLIKPTPTARRLLPAAGLVEPYPGASPMLMVEIEDRDQIARVVSGVAAEVPQTRGRSRRG